MEQWAAHGSWAAPAQLVRTINEVTGGAAKTVADLISCERRISNAAAAQNPGDCGRDGFDIVRTAGAGG
jgi:hypothetical protein